MVVEQLRRIFPKALHGFTEFVKLAHPTAGQCFEKQLAWMGENELLVCIVSSFNDYSVRIAHVPDQSGNPVPFLSTRILKDAAEMTEGRMARYEMKDAIRFLEFAMNAIHELQKTRNVVIVFVIPPLFDLYGSFRFMLGGENLEPLNNINIKKMPYRGILKMITNDLKIQEKFLCDLNLWATKMAEIHNSVFVINYLNVVNTMKVPIMNHNDYSFYSERNIIDGVVSNYTKGISSKMGIVPAPELFAENYPAWFPVFDYVQFMLGHREGSVPMLVERRLLPLARKTESSSDEDELVQPVKMMANSEIMAIPHPDIPASNMNFLLGSRLEAIVPESQDDSYRKAIVKERKANELVLVDPSQPMPSMNTLKRWQKIYGFDTLHQTYNYMLEISRSYSESLKNITENFPNIVIKKE